MSFTVPVTPDNLDELPDNTSLIEKLAAKPNITTVLPRFYGIQDTGRFVTAFFVFHGDNGRKVTLYTRRRTSADESKLEKQTTITLTNPPTITGNIWNQTILIKNEDINAIERLKQRVEYDCYWLSSGYEPDIAFDEYSRDPFASTPSGLPECDHANVSEPAKMPTLDITVSLCEDCGIPLLLATDNGAIEAHNTLKTDFIGVPAGDEQSPARGTTVTPAEPLTNDEITLHVLSRFANVEQSHFDIYARNNTYGYLLTLYDNVAGYAFWNKFDGYTALQQIYLFPEYRGSGLGELLVRAWYEHLGVDHYFAIGPNTAGTATLENLGHLDDGVATPATILSCKDTLNADQVNANYADQIRRGNDPLDP